MVTSPLVSVIMPVYNNEDYLAEAINSVLSQSYSNFEFLIVDDGSKDNSKNIIQQFSDKRITLIENKFNIGLPASLNKALKIANGEYIARMDGDDICLKHRLAKQIRYLEKHKEIDICGASISRIDKKGKVFKRISKNPRNNNQIKASTIFSPKLFHPTVIFRSSFIKRNNIQYDEHAIRVEDFKLWSDIIFNYDALFANIPTSVLKYRDIPNKILKLSGDKIQLSNANQIRARNLNKLGIKYKSVDRLMNKLFKREQLCKTDYFRLIIVMREINRLAYDLFKAYPKLKHLVDLHELGFKSIYLLYSEKLYRNLSFKKQLRYIFMVIFN